MLRRSVGGLRRIVGVLRRIVGVHIYRAPYQYMVFMPTIVAFFLPGVVLLCDDGRDLTELVLVS